MIYLDLVAQYTHEAWDCEGLQTLQRNCIFIVLFIIALAASATSSCSILSESFDYYCFKEIGLFENPQPFSHLSDR